MEHFVAGHDQGGDKTGANQRVEQCAREAGVDRWKVGHEGFLS